MEEAGTLRHKGGCTLKPASLCAQIFNSSKQLTCTAATGSVQRAASPSSRALGCLSASGLWRRLRLAGWQQQACTNQLGSDIRQAWMQAPFTCYVTAAGQDIRPAWQAPAPEPCSQHQQRQEGTERLQHPQRRREVDSAV